MDMNEYTFEVVVCCRLAELRAEAEQWNHHGAASLPSRPLRDAVGRVLIRMGTRLVGVGEGSRVEGARTSLEWAGRGP
jgi:hypothetical protein